MKTRLSTFCFRWPVLIPAVYVAVAMTVSAASKPNIIFVLSDDVAQGDLGCYGQKLIKTPNLDRMAEQGTRFMQCYTGTSVCAPARASLITGLHTGHCPIRANWEIKPEGQLPLPAETITLAQILKKAGYATACMGKWGMGMFDTTGSPLKKGFDHFFGYNCQMHAHSYFPTYLYRDDQRFTLPGNTGTNVGPIYAQNLIQEDVLKWVRAQKDQPFFLFYAVTLPHGRFEIDNLGQYASKTNWTAQQRNYAAMVTRLDSDVGQLLQLLKDLGLDEKTIVFVAGDNGSSFNPNSPMGKRFAQAANGLRGFKREMYEGGLRQAALVRWPGQVPKRVSDEPWAFWDFLPTAVELAGAELPPGFKSDGSSLVSMLKGGAAPKRDYFYWELHETKSLQAVRFGDWKAVKNGPSAKIELYDLKTDPGETNNVAAAQPDLVAKAVAYMKEAHVEDPNWPMVERRRPTGKYPTNSVAKPFAN